MDGGGGEALLDAVAGGFVFKGGDGDDMDGFGKGTISVVPFRFLAQPSSFATGESPCPATASSVGQ